MSREMREELAGPTPPVSAAHFLRETVGRCLVYGGARGQLTVRADSGFYAHCRCRLQGSWMSASRYHHPPDPVPKACGTCSIWPNTRVQDWTPIPYWMDGAADVARDDLHPVPDRSLRTHSRPVTAHCPAWVKPTPRFASSPSSPDTAITPSSPTRRWGPRPGTG